MKTDVLNWPADYSKDAPVTKVTLKIENSDGGVCETATFIPRPVADELLSNLHNWKNKWQGTFREVEWYMNAIKAKSDAK